MNSTAKLLVVDDDFNNRDLLTRRLQRSGFAVLATDNGRDAVAAVANEQIDLVLLDSMMPGLSGIDVLKLLRATYTPDELPVIMVTALAESEKMIEAIGLGANDYITKPLDFPVALARIRSQLSRKATDEARRLDERRYALAARASNDGLWDWDLGSQKIYYSARWKEMLGYAESEISDDVEEWFSRVPPPDREELRAAIERNWAATESAPLDQEHRILHKDGNYRWFLCRGLALRNAAGKVIRMAGSVSDITDRKIHDALTGLANRLLFAECLGRALEPSGGVTRRQFAVFFLDLDRFKLINDSMGHLAGDQLLTGVAERLRQTIHAELQRCGVDPATIARFGGDEFAVLLEGICEVEQAGRVADRILEALHAPFVIKGRDVFCTASIGIALGARGYRSAADVLRDADTAMYAAKARGKGCWAAFDVSMRDSVVARMELENDLQRAMDNGQFQVYYQPKIHLASERIAGFEALIRWRHPTRGLIGPTEFIPTAEDDGLIVPIGAWVLRESCRQVREWNAEFAPDPPLVMSVNVSARQFRDPDLVSTIQNTLVETGVPPEWIDLEITESVLFDSFEMALRVLKGLKSLGVGLKMDDFGTGYSCLSYLSQLPFDTLKIDRSFTVDVSSDATSQEMVKTILEMAQRLRMAVIAEGVEDLAQAKHLQHMGCEFGQGFYFSRPVPAEEARELLRTCAAQPRGSSSDCRVIRC